MFHVFKLKYSSSHPYTQFYGPYKHSHTYFCLWVNLPWFGHSRTEKMLTNEAYFYADRPTCSSSADVYTYIHIEKWNSTFVGIFSDVHTNNSREIDIFCLILLLFLPFRSRLSTFITNSQATLNNSNAEYNADDVDSKEYKKGERKKLQNGVEGNFLSFVCLKIPFFHLFF